MKKFAEQLGLLIISMTLIWGAACQQVCAHDLWMQIRDYTPEKGDDITLTLGYGHYLPAREFMPSKDLEEIYMLAPDGKRIKIKHHSEVEYGGEKPLKKEGTYLVVAKRKGGLSTKTTEGWQRGQSKKGLKNVIKCTFSEKFTKAIVNVGKAEGKNISKVLGHDLEIVPLTDPGALSQGDYLLIKVLLKGQPLSYNPVFATYMGFSTEKSAYAYATKTDKTGLAKIKMLQSGVWLITTSLKEHYPDSTECDEYSFKSTLTFEIR